MKAYLNCELCTAEPQMDSKGGHGYVVTKHAGFVKFWLPNFLFDAQYLPIETVSLDEGKSIEEHITPELVDGFIRDVGVIERECILTVTALLINGFEMIESIDLSNLGDGDDAGEKLCMERIKARIKEALSFALQWAVSLLSSAGGSR